MKKTKYKTGELYCMPEMLESLQLLRVRLKKMDDDTAKAIKDEVNGWPFGMQRDIQIIRFKPMELEELTADPADFPAASTYQTIRFKRVEYRIVLWECAAGDEEEKDKNGEET